MRIKVDENSGFCTGVVKAVEKAEKRLMDEGPLYSLGKIVHNTGEVNRLSEKGLKALTYEEFNQLKDTTVLIRAHGEPPQTFETARRNNIRLIDATCPVVRRLQQRIRNKQDEMENEGGTILIFGKKDHPEVRALIGQSKGKPKVVRYAEDLDNLDLTAPLALYSQTTMNLQDYADFQEHLKDRIRKKGGDPMELLSVNQTICGQVSSREAYLRIFAAEHDAILFVSGKESSNGQALFKVCQEVNKDSYFVTHPEDVDHINLEGKASVGISGATSTPGWLIKDVKAQLRKRYE